MTDAINEHLLEAYSTSFYGYGAYSAPIWFVGTEEGGGLMERLVVWTRRGRPELDDVGEFHAENGVTKWFGERASLQPTLKHLARIALVADDHSDHNEFVRRYQGTCLGRPNGGPCLLELLPLPCRSTSHWPYAGQTTLSHLADRRAYRDYYGPRRAEHLKKRVDEHGPKAVVFYGVDGWYRQWWEQIASTGLAQVDDDGMWLGTRAGTAFMIIKHPAAQGMTSDYFRRAGGHLARATTSLG